MFRDRFICKNSFASTSLNAVSINGNVTAVQLKFHTKSKTPQSSPSSIKPALEYIILQELFSSSFFTSAEEIIVFSMKIYRTYPVYDILSLLVWGIIQHLHKIIIKEECVSLPF